MKTKQWIFVVLLAALILSLFFGINASDEATAKAGMTYALMIGGVLVAWLLALRLKVIR